MIDKTISNKTRILFAATFALAATLHAQTFETFLGVIASTDRYECATNVLAQGASEVEFEKLTEGWQVQISGVCKSLAGSGSLLLSLPLGEDEDLAFQWDGSSNDTRVFMGIPKDISDVTGVPKELVWRLRFYPYDNSGEKYRVKLETFDANTKQWSLAHHQVFSLPRFEAWLTEEEGATMGIGLAFAELADVKVELFRQPTILMIR